jgi:Tol biopolymer transport system component
MFMRKKWFFLAIAITGVVAGLLTVGLVITGCSDGGVSDTGFPAGYPIERVSVGSGDIQANNDSYNPSISEDGRYVAYDSSASNLVAGDTNDDADIFVFDRQTGIVERVSVASDGAEGNSGSNYTSISADGRYVAFESFATNLVSGDTNGVYDIFVYDRELNTVERVSISTGGGQGNSSSYDPFISGDGRYVAFESYATNLVSGDTNADTDVFVYDRETDAIKRVSVSSSGTQANDRSYNPSVSADGRYVAFDSRASNLVPDDTNGVSDIFVYDQETDTIERVSMTISGTEADGGSAYPFISVDGRYVVYESGATNLVAGITNGRSDIFFHDRQNGTVERVSVASDGTEGNENSFYASISMDGRYVFFSSYASNLVDDDTNDEDDTFVYDRQTDTLKRVSVDSGGIAGNDESINGFISANGNYVVFESDAINLVASDTNECYDIFAAPVQ